MTGVTLRYKWITRAMFQEFPVWSRPPLRDAIIKNVYISLGSGSLAGDNNTQSIV
jgi:hypothetical protein